MTEEQSGHDKSLSKTKNIQTDQNTRRAAEEREGMGMHERSALPKTGMGEKPEAGYWDQMKPEDSSDMSMDKSRFGVFEKEGGTGASVAKEGTDYRKDVRPMNQSGVYAEKDAKTWKDMAKGQDAGGASKGTSETGEETASTGTQGQHWRGEPWAKNPKVGGKETTETEPGTSGQHWRGEDMPTEKKTDTKSRTNQ
ncbi:MAG: hypothetical protein ABFC89_13220 [Methanospirillum sp.]